MKYLSIFISFLIACCANAIAENWSVKSFEQAPLDLSASISGRIDNNGEHCALIKIVAPHTKLSVQGNIIGEVQQIGSEFWCYITTGSKDIKLLNDNYTPLYIRFNEYGISGLTSKSTYTLVIDCPLLEIIKKSEGFTSDESFENLKKIAAEFKKWEADEIGPFENGLAPIKKDGKYGFISKDGVMLTAFDFDHYNKWTKFWEVEKGKKFGLIDTLGRLVVDFNDGHFMNSSDNPYISQLTSKGRNIVDGRTGKVIAKNIKLGSKSKYNRKIGNNGIENDFSCYYNQEGEKLFNREFEWANKFSQNVALAKTKEDGWIIMDQNGSTVAKCPAGITFSNHAVFKEDLAPFEDIPSHKIGFINLLGKIVIPAEYSEVSSFSEGLAAVKKDDQWQYIDKNGNVIIQSGNGIILDKKHYHNGFTIAYDERKRKYEHQYLIDKDGKTVLSGYMPAFEQGYYNNRGFIPFSKSFENSKFAYFDENLVQLTPYRFTSAKKFEDDITIVWENGPGIIDTFGNIVWLNDLSFERDLFSKSLPTE